jgi:hypothetical protein
MAVDFRVPATAKERAWLENALLGLENARVLDVTREKYPPHYHVAVFPAEYLAYAEKRMASEPKIEVPPVKESPAAESKTAAFLASRAAPAASADTWPAIATVTFLTLLLGALLGYPRLHSAVTRKQQ